MFASLLAAIGAGRYSWSTPVPDGSFDDESAVLPNDRVGLVEYEYDAAGRLWKVKATAGGTVVASNRYDYDARGNLVADWQCFGAVVPANPNPATTPRTGYAWEYAPTDPLNPGAAPGRVRLASMVYPEHPGVSARTVGLGYGAAGSADDLLSRVASMTTNFGTPTVAEFSYAGVSRRSRLATAAAALAVSFAAAGGGVVGLPGLDAYGRVRDLHWQNAAPTPATLFRAQYTHDASGNRLTARVTQAPGQGGVNRDNVFSQVNTYDALHRLIGTDVGTLLPGSPPTIDPQSAFRRTDTWSPDLLGNWAGGGSAAGRRSEGNLDGHGTPWANFFQGTPDSGPDTADRTHTPNYRNEAQSIFEDNDDWANPRTTDTEYDPAGNLTFDGEYFYQYDAWNRLIQVNEAVHGAG